MIKARPRFPGVQASGLGLLQVNLGRVCNQACRHCHLAAGPDRSECMSWDIQRAVLAQERATRGPVAR